MSLITGQGWPVLNTSSHKTARSLSTRLDTPTLRLTPKNLGEKQH